MTEPRLSIVYHHRTMGDGAEGIHVAEIVRALKELGHRVNLVCPRVARTSPGLQDQPPALVQASPKLPRRLKQSLEIAYNAITYARVRRAIHRYQPDLIYERYSSYNFGGVMAARHHRVPLILEVNATYAGKFGSEFPVVFPRSLAMAEKYSLQYATGIVVVSNALRECVEMRGVRPEVVHVSPNAINPGKIASLVSSHSRAAIRQELRLEDSVVVGFVGSLREWHGIDFLAQAIPAIAVECPKVKFLIVGSGNLKSLLVDVINENGLADRVILTGALPHERVFPHIAAMDIGLMPDSNPWGSPMKVLEYMAIGCVPVGPDLGPMMEIVANDVTGKLFRRRDLTQFVSTLVELAKDENLRRRLSENAQRYVYENRTWQNNAGEIIDLFRRVSAR